MPKSLRTFKTITGEMQKMLSIKKINLLQAQNEGYRKQNESLQKENAELKAENERLKEKLNGKRFICTDCMAFAKRIEQYKQTLQEIKKIAESKVKPNLVKRMNGTAMYGINKIIELTKAEEE